MPGKPLFHFVFERPPPFVEISGGEHFLSEPARHLRRFREGRAGLRFSDRYVPVPAGCSHGGPFVAGFEKHDELQCRLSLHFLCLGFVVLLGPVGL